MLEKNIPDPGFADDDGSADPRLAAALAAYAADPAAGPEVLAALRGTRLLVPVVAVLGEVETGPGGLRQEKSSDMAVPTLRAPDGRRALPAFTSTDALARWDPAARPVAVPLHQALRAAAQEAADTVVLDLAGPVPYQLSGAELLALAEGRESADPLADPAVGEALRAVLAAEPGVRLAHLVPGAAGGPVGGGAEGGGRVDGVLALALTPGARAQDVVRAVASALAADEVLRARLVYGLDLALLPEETATAREPFYVRQA
ncbi:SseB family protein [Streptomyces sp. TP-A0874]|uniref:SseB family protein n=1 Tax=Streptomyces sp. TP-A0874 TaxID=549819 RepID=UPI000AA9916D|nr:SseB family protein [Streptomyces sp. TP-A0874]